MSYKINNILNSFCWWHVKAIQGFFQGDLYRDRDETLCQVQCESIRRPSLFVLLHLPSSSSWLSSSSCLLPKPVLLSWGCFPRRAKGIVCPKSGSPTTPSLPSLQHVKSEYPVLHSSPLHLSSTSSSWNLNKVFHWGFILQSTIRRGDDPFQVESKYSGSLHAGLNTLELEPSVCHPLECHCHHCHCYCHCHHCHCHRYCHCHCVAIAIAIVTMWQMQHDKVHLKNTRRNIFVIGCSVESLQWRGGSCFTDAQCW